MHDKSRLIGVIDEGTKATRFVIFQTPNFEELCSHEIEIKQISPNARWVEQDPLQIIDAVRACYVQAIQKMDNIIPNTYNVKNITTIGVTNQRETVVAWDKYTGEPLYNAIVWTDCRTEEIADQILREFPFLDEHIRKITGLSISPYFSATKLLWLKMHVPAVQEAILSKRCLVGTIDTWVIWNLTGGVNGGLHITDVTNASRTLLMNIDTLQWDPTLLKAFDIDPDILPEIRTSSEIYGKIADGSVLDGITISGILGNQQSSLVGQSCFEKGQMKNTYRSACFLMCNTGEQKIISSHGLVTTVAYKMGKDQPTIYALEGSVAVGGAALRWLQNRLGMLKSTEESELLASSVYSTGDVYFVPAFNGLYAPYAKKDAKGIICGLTGFTTKNHIIRAALEAICFQTRDIIEAMQIDMGIKLMKMNADGPMGVNNLLMQLQADLCGVPVLRSKRRDATALGVALAAGQAIGIDLCSLKTADWDSIRNNNVTPHYDVFQPMVVPEERNKRYTKWHMAVDRSAGIYENTTIRKYSVAGD